MREVTQTLKNFLPGVAEQGQGGVGSGGRGGQGPESRFWEAELPAFIERCLSSSITYPQALPAINELFMVSFAFAIVVGGFESKPLELIRLCEARIIECSYAALKALAPTVLVPRAPPSAPPSLPRTADARSYRLAIADPSPNAATPSADLDASRTRRSSVRMLLQQLRQVEQPACPRGGFERGCGSRGYWGDGIG